VTATPASPVSTRTRCSPSELRIQWSAVCSGQGGNAASVARLHLRIDEAMAAIDKDLLVAANDAAVSVLRAEIVEVREIDAGLRRMRP